MIGDSYLPLFAFLVLLALLLPAAIAARERKVSARWGIPIAILLAALILSGYLIMAFTYAFMASFFDHFEPSIAQGALRLLAGEQAFSNPTDAAQYASIYDLTPTCTMLCLLRPGQR